MNELKQKLTEIGQVHLLQYWDTLVDHEKSELLDDIAQLDLDECRALAESYVRHYLAPPLPEDIAAAHIFPTPENADAEADYAGAMRIGEDAIRNGEVAAFTVAGGQGTRLGFAGPKGAFPITPIRDAPLFQVFAEYLLGVERRYGKPVNWYIMTSPLNHEETVAFFAGHGFFGLAKDQVEFFQQGSMPVFHPDGKIAMAGKSRISLSPDGHGGSLRALRTSGALARMQRRGEKYISYFQVDNPLVHCVDPLFIGLHIREKSEVSSKAVPKSHDLERVGNFCVGDGRLQVIEYSDLPESLALQKNPDGSRKFDAGSIAIHVFNREFVERLTHPTSTVRLPWHRAEKAVAVLGPDGKLETPSRPNVVKLEMFVFDAIPAAGRAIVMFTDRKEEFSPVKNAEGADSPAVARRDLSERAVRWLAAAGVNVQRDAGGEPRFPVEISPRFAINEVDLREQIRGRDVDRNAPLLLA
ncbi:MAG: UTP--glucose-1-phosphate uridylyltransferase [Phycisphaerae bacterium]